MTFDYRDNDGDTFIVTNNKTDAGQPVVWMATSPDGVYIDLNRVEEVVAGIRDAARTAAARQTTGQDDTWPASTSFEPQDHPGADLYVRLRKAGEDHDTAQALIYAHARMAVRQHTAIHGDGPAVGQPAEAHGTSVWTPANLHFLRFALGCAAAVMYSEDDFTEEDYAALDQLRAFAGPSPEEQAAETLAAADTVEGER